MHYPCITLICCAALLSPALACTPKDNTANQDKIGVGNPYLPLWEHLPDGEPRVFEDPDNPGKYRAYVVGSHDTSFDKYCGADIHMWSAPVEDLTDWRDEGAIFTYSVDGEWDIMYAPDLVETPTADGGKEYYLYPHSRGDRREAMVCKGSRPDGPFTPINLNEDGTAAVEGGVLGFDPSVYIDICDDNEKGYRAYGYWGFQRSSAAELDPNTMCSVRPGTEMIPYFIPASTPNGEIRDPEGTQYPALYKDQDPHDFNFFEASSIRKVGNKYVMIFSGYSGKEYGLGNTNSTLRYAYGDSPLGPWRSGGVLVDSRGVVLNRDGSSLIASNAAHNTHGSIQEINGQWYAFYHRPPRGFGFARQAMVAPIKITWDETPVAEGGKVTITGYDPYSADNTWTAEAKDGNAYMGAEVTSEGFQIYGLDPYKYYSAGYACYLSNVGAQTDSWDIWDNSMPVILNDKDIVGFKYFGFGGLEKAEKGLKPFAGTKDGNGTMLDVFVEPATDEAFSIDVMLDGPWENDVHGGKKIATIQVPANSAKAPTRFSADVANVVDNLDKKHAIYLVASNENGGNIGTLHGIGFYKKGEELEMPVAPKVAIAVDGKNLEMPSEPARMNKDNGYTGFDVYEVPCAATGKITAKADNKDVKIDIDQEGGIVKCDYRGKVKTYKLVKI
ncbi:MAG: hypothetical protein NC102_00460 [Clostridium sp.]|nr:hypothetical protein [Clostridium sp.]